MKDGYYIIDGKQRGIWVVDDKEFNIDEVRRYFEKCGFTRREIADYLKEFRQNPIEIEK